MVKMSWLKNNSLLKTQLLRGGIWAFVGKTFRMVSGFIVNALLARLLSPDEVGAYFLTFSLITFLSILAQFGMKTTIVRLISESMSKGLQGRAKNAIQQAFFYTTVCGVLVSAIYYLYLGEVIAISAFDSPLMADVVSVSALWIIVFTYQSIFSEVFRGFHSIGLASIFDGLLTSLLLALLLGIDFILFDSVSLFHVVMISVVVWFVADIVALFIMRNKLSLLSGGGVIKSKEIINIAWPQMITAISFFIIAQSALLIVGLYLPDSDAAIYGSSLRLVTLVSFPLLVLNAVVPPHIAGMYAKGEIRKMEVMLRATATIAGVPSIIILVIFVLYGEPLLGMLYGDFYREGAVILGVLSFGQLLNVWAGSCGNVLLMTGGQKNIMHISITCSAVAILGSLVLVKPYGITGVAVMSSSALALQNIWMLLSVKKRIGIYTHMNLREVRLFFKL